MEGEDLPQVVVEGERWGQGQDDFDLSNLNEFEESVLSEDDLMDVSIHEDEVEDKF